MKENNIMASVNNGSDLTVLLMLKDRVPFTYRWMSYMNSIKFPFKIFIADGGLDEKVTEVLSNKANYPNIDYEYVRYPYDRSYVEYYIKIADALSRIETPFTAISDNDDLCVASGLARSVDFMKNNPEYASCRGQVGGFVVKPARSNDMVDGEVKKLFPVYMGVSNACETAAERVQKQFLNYDPTFYDLHRTDHLKKCFEVLREISPENIYLAELLTGFLTVAAGKIKREPYLFYLRQCNSPGSSNMIESKKYDFFDRMLLESWSHDFTKTMKAIAQEIARKDKVSIDDAYVLIKSDYKKYVTPNIIWSLTREQPVKLTQLPGKIANSVLHRFTRGRFLRKAMTLLGLSKSHYRAEVSSIRKFFESYSYTEGSWK